MEAKLEATIPMEVPGEDLEVEVILDSHGAQLNLMRDGLGEGHIKVRHSLLGGFTVELIGAKGDKKVIDMTSYLD